MRVLHMPDLYIISIGGNTPVDGEMDEVGLHPEQRIALTEYGAKRLLGLLREALNVERFKADVGADGSP